MIEELHSKSYQATVYLARYFLSIDINTKIKTVSEILEDVDFARGTIQNAIELLRESKAITLISHGKMGKRLLDKNIDLLMKFADINFIIGVMPLPYSKRYEGLSTGIIKELKNKLSVPATMAYMRGALKRIEMVISGRYDFAIISKYALNKFNNLNNNQLSIIANFGIDSFVSDHVLVFSDSTKVQIEDGMRIGIDYDSIDQAELTLLEIREKSVHLIPLSYTQFLSSIEDGTIDGVIWNADEVIHPEKQYKIVPLSRNNKDNTIAVMVTKSSMVETTKILSKLIDVNEIINTQRKVLKGEMLPEY
ncbi:MULTISPECIES: GntR family transcriptional regulator YhfZ [Terrabacteria group]|uniref:GntR family transcriptional regulator YhfZ n=1 Tax=Bacillati TaxID=1783272 RepID=UPI001C6EE680|nr:MULTISPECIES: GntR family transcriptional regulator YhfZ [Terrabacteria group]MBW9212990.1 hypothetical protein [Trueperella sp. zg.1013]